VGAPKGHPRYGGRKKGTPNKPTQDLMAICEKHGCNPFEGMVMIAMRETDQDKQFDKFERIAQYVFPKRKAIEGLADGAGSTALLSAEDRATIHQMVVEDRAKRAKK